MGVAVTAVVFRITLPTTTGPVSSESSRHGAKRRGDLSYLKLAETVRNLLKLETNTVRLARNNTG